MWYVSGGICTCGCFIKNVGKLTVVSCIVYHFLLSICDVYCLEVASISGGFEFVLLVFDVGNLTVLHP